MGMFDYITYEGKEYQTKSLVCWLDKYEIKPDGTLWHEVYDIEDHSDPTKEGLERFIGALAKVNKHWIQEFYTGEVRFHSWDEEKEIMTNYSAYFHNGELKEMHKLGENAND